MNVWRIIRRELSDRKLALAAYCLIAILLVVLYISIYPSVQHMFQQRAQLLKSYPRGVLKAFGVEDLTFDTLEKYIAAEQYGFTWPILVITLALSRAGNALAGEIERGTMGFLLSLPVTRTRLFLSKLAAGLLALVGFVAVSVLCVIPVAAVFGVGFESGRYLQMAGLGALFAGSVYGVGVWLSSWFSERSKVYFAAAGILVAMYAANIVANLVSGAGWLKYGSLFYYFNAQQTLVHGSVSSLSWGVMGGFAAVTIALGWWRFRRRDISV